MLNLEFVVRRLRKKLIVNAISALSEEFVDCSAIQTLNRILKPLVPMVQGSSAIFYGFV